MASTAGYHRVMGFEAVANVIVEVVAAQAIIGLALFAIVIGALVHALISEHHRGGQRSDSRARR